MSENQSVEDAVPSPAAAHGAADADVSFSEENFLRDHEKHIFIFSSAGKPIFSYHGHESEIGPVIGSLLVLSTFPLPAATTHGDGKSVSPRSSDSSGSGSAPSPPATLRWGCGTKGGVELRMSFLKVGELNYAAVRRQQSAAVISTDEEEAANSLAAQLRLVHSFLLTIAPNIQEILLTNARCDVRNATALFGTVQWDMLRSFIHGLEYSATLTFGALPVLGTPLVSLPQPRWLQLQLASLTRLHQTPYRICSLVYQGGSVLALSEGAPSTQAKGRAAPPPPPAGAPTQYTQVWGLPCGTALSGDDYLLLESTVRSVLARGQHGETWLPICMPHLNCSGFVWCYVLNLGGFLRSEQRLSHRGGGDTLEYFSPSALASTECSGEEGVILIQLSYSQDDFAACSRVGTDLARAIGRCGGAVRAMEELEVEVEWRRDRCCAGLFKELLFPSDEDVDRTTFQSLGIFARLAAGERRRQQQHQHPQQERGDDAEDGEPSRRPTRRAREQLVCPLQYFAITVAVKGEAKLSSSANVLSDAAEGSVYHDLWKSAPLEDEAQELAVARALVRSALARLRAAKTAASNSSPHPLVILSGSSTSNGGGGEGPVVVALRPTSSLVSALLGSFYTQSRPSNSASAAVMTVAEEEEGGAREEPLPCEELIAPMPYSGGAVKEVAQRATEAVLVFSPGTPEPTMLYWVCRLLHMMSVKGSALELVTPQKV